MAWYWDQLVNNAFGNYRNVLQDVTLNPAMGYYLNTRGNQKEKGIRIGWLMRDALKQQQKIRQLAFSD